MKYLRLTGLMSYSNPNYTSGLLVKLNQIIRVADDKGSLLLAQSYPNYLTGVVGAIFTDVGGTAFDVDGYGEDQRPSRSITPVHVGPWAERPLPGAVKEQSRMIVTDLGASGSSDWVLQGGFWRPVNGSALLVASSLPVAIPGSGTISADGLLTVLPAFARAWAGIGRVYCGASAGLTAGWYYGTWLSTTSVQLWTDALATVKPVTTAGAYTAPITESLGLPLLSLPGAVMAPNSTLRLQYFISNSNSGNSKTVRAKFGANVAGALRFQGIGATTSTQAGVNASIKNSNSLSLQIGNDGNNGDFSGSGALQQLTVNTAEASVLTVTLQIAAVTDVLTVHSHKVWLED